jgi:beta-glucosidase-like glycosyl hydrolase
MAFYQFLVPRLNGREASRDFGRHLAMVRQGVAGFIVFGGGLEEVREGIRRLQSESTLPLLICSDLEQGLGQQLEGGTLFPPAMAMGNAYQKDPALVRAAFTRMAEEAAYAGINAILAPVLDVDTNPDNPIIATRAFGGDAALVSALGVEMVRAFRSKGVASCGKHFPGHGDTSVDSHIGLPKVDKSLAELEACELRPFKSAIDAGVDMVMLGHLSVPALDPSGLPATLSLEAVRYLREKMGFEGIAITDAMDMGGLAGYGEAEAALMALRAGVDVLLHPKAPERLAARLEARAGEFAADRLIRFRRALLKQPAGTLPPSDTGMVERLTEISIKLNGSIEDIKHNFILILNDESEDRGQAFVDAVRRERPEARHLRARSLADLRALPAEGDLIVAVFSPVRAYKGGASSWVREALVALRERASVFVSFGSPYLIDLPGAKAARLYAYWGSPVAQEAAARRLMAGATPRA